MNPLRFLVALLILAPAAPAEAGCVAECQSSVYCDNTPGWDCNSRLNDCYRTCNNDRASASYGAIAYGKSSQAWGYSYGYDDSAGAQRKAMSTCRPNGNDCAIVSTFSDGCAAVAAAEGPGYAVAQGKTEEAAKGQALKLCGAGGIKGCEIQVWSCAER